MMSLNELLEYSGVILNLIFLILVIREDIRCWIFGILGSAVSIALFVKTQLYSEAILFSFYVIMGFYGWYNWSNGREGKSKKLKVSEKSPLFHAFWIFICSSVFLTLGWYFNENTDAARPFGDAFSTIFSFFATYLEAAKILSAWLYWIVINGFSIWLYFDRGLNIYSILALVYFIMSFVGLYSWKKSFNKN